MLAGENALLVICSKEWTPFNINLNKNVKLNFALLLFCGAEVQCFPEHVVINNINHLEDSWHPREDLMGPYHLFNIYSPHTIQYYQSTNLLDILKCVRLWLVNVYCANSSFEAYSSCIFYFIIFYPIKTLKYQITYHS